MKLNQTERDEVELLIGQMEKMSENYASSESNDCRYVAYYMGRFADRFRKLSQGDYDFEQKEEAMKKGDL